MITVIQGDGYSHADSNINSQYDLLMLISTPCTVYAQLAYI